MTQSEYDAGLAPNGQSLVKDAPVIETAPWKDRAGNIHQVPVGIDPGWDYNPGKAALRAKNLEQVTADKLAAASAPIRGAAVTADKLAAASAPIRGAAEEAKTAKPKTLDDFIAAGNKITETLGVDADPIKAYDDILERLNREVGTQKECAAIGDESGPSFIKAASKRYPDSWTKASDDLGELNVKFEFERGYCYTAYEDNTYDLYGIIFKLKAGDGVISCANTRVALHELANRLQACHPRMDALFQEIHKRRTVGEELESLLKLTGDKRYDIDEMTRKDGYANPYQGKEYNGVPLEVMSVGLEYVLAVRDLYGNVKTECLSNFIKMYNEDREMFDLVVGLLFHWEP